jgi:single-strand DNA-binding protein
MSKGTVNKMILLGRLGQDPEVRTTASGTQIVNLNVATNEAGPKDQNGNRQDVTEWHRVVLFGKTAEIAAQYLNKGSQVYIEGRLQTRKWQDPNGADRYSTEIVGNEMQFIGGRPDNSQSSQPTEQRANQPMNQQPAQGGQSFGQVPQKPQQQRANQQQPAPGGFDDPDAFDDDIPFS